MATAPQIELRDGSGTSTAVVWSTNEEHITINGTIDTNTVAMQVSVNGATFNSDATLIEIDGQDWTFPSPTSYPDGFSLELGVNTFAFRAIDILGGVSATSTAEVERVATIAAAESLIPTGVRLRRRRNAVDLLVSKVEVTNLEFLGFNFYASATPGGTDGYFKINSSLVSEVSTTVLEEDLTSIDTNTTVFEPLTTASTLRLRVTQENSVGVEQGLVLDRQTSILGLSQLKFTQTLQERSLQEFVVFRHNRIGGQGIVNSDQFVDVAATEPLYYVVSAVYYDASTAEEFETPFSQEIIGSPLIIDTAIRDLPGRTRLQIVLAFIAAVQRVNQEISLLPGSTTRDVAIDPFSSEAERIWFLTDFVHRSQSFVTLLQIDDANQDGISDAVASSAYKQALKAALGFQSDAAVQQLIDNQFDKIAGNLQTPRLSGRPAVGQVVFYSAKKPSLNVTFASGSVVSSEPDTANNISSVRFVVGGTFVMPAADADAFYNFDTQRYELTADISAESLGSVGNVSAGRINNMLTPVNGFSVVNTEATNFGNDRESNPDLAVRAQLALVSIDTGTEGGYQATSANQVGTIKTKIVKSADPLMMRDYDDVRQKHIGGKVDVWVQGLRERTLTERFAFTFEVARDIRCQIIDVANLIFRVLDSRVTVDTPIVELLDNLSQGLGVRNATIGQDYDLTGAVILDHETFQLDIGITQPVTNLDDIVFADYRFRSVNQFFFSVQPVRRVTSVVGEVSGALSLTEGFDLYKTDDPLLEGESTIARNYLLINQIGGIPSGDTILINDEQHVMIGFFEESLRNIGINTATIRVFNEARTVEYLGPGNLVPDFDIFEGTPTVPAKIARTTASQIVSGETVSIDYEHDENFTVTYVVNDILQQLQRTLDRRRHITADVLAKQAINNAIDIETTVQLKSGAKKDKVDPLVRTSTSRELNQKLIGQGSAQSDIVNAIDSTIGVDFQVLPLARMGYADGSRKIRESISSSSARVSSLDIGGNQVFILTSALKSPTTDGGGLPTEHKGVFQDHIMLSVSEDAFTVGQSDDQAFIIGAEGETLTGWSDDATLIAAGFTDPDDIEVERLRRTANHILISLSGADVPPDAPENHQYAVSYIVRGDRGPHDIEASSVEVLELGKFTVTYRSGD